MAQYFPNQVMISEMSQMVNEMKDLRADIMSMPIGGGGGGLSIPSLSRVSSISSSIEAKFDEILRNRPKDIADEIERAKTEAQKNYDEVKKEIDELEFKGDPVPDELRDKLKEFETFKQKFDKFDAEEFEKKFGKTGVIPGKLTNKNKSIIENLLSF